MDKKKIIWMGLAITALGVGAYSVFHQHKGFEVCLWCGKYGWFGVLGGFAFFMALRKEESETKSKNE